MGCSTLGLQIPDWAQHFLAARALFCPLLQWFAVLLGLTCVIWIACWVPGDLRVTLGWMMPGSFNSLTRSFFCEGSPRSWPIGLSPAHWPSVDLLSIEPQQVPHLVPFHTDLSGEFGYFYADANTWLHLWCPPVQTQNSCTPACVYVAHMAMCLLCTRQEIHIALAPSLNFRNFHRRFYHPHSTAEEAGLSAASQSPSRSEIQTQSWPTEGWVLFNVIELGQLHTQRKRFWWHLPHIPSKSLLHLLFKAYGYSEITLPENASGHPIYAAVSLLRQIKLSAFIQHLRLTDLGLAWSEPLDLKML